MNDAAKIAAGLTEAHKLHEDLTSNWDAFCDADPLPYFRDDFPESLERAGYATLRSVNDEDLDCSFAADRGIITDGDIWVLTPLGLAVRKHLEQSDG